MAVLYCRLGGKNIGAINTQQLWHKCFQKIYIAFFFSLFLKEVIFLSGTLSPETSPGRVTAADDRENLFLCLQLSDTAEHRSCHQSTSLREISFDSGLVTL
jgi:hypothetical protein